MIELSLVDIFSSVIPSALTCLGCLWLLISFTFLSRKIIGHYMIALLAISDLMFGVDMLAATFKPIIQTESAFIYTSFFSMYFSVIWASGISVLVYRSLKNENFNSKLGFLVCFFIAAGLSVFFAML